MRLIKKSETENLVTAVSQVSEYTVEELKNKRSKAILPWVKIGMWIAREHCGHTYEEAAGLFGKHFSSCYAAVKDVELERDYHMGAINNVLEAKKELDSAVEGEEIHVS